MVYLRRCMRDRRANIRMILLSAPCCSDVIHRIRIFKLLFGIYFISLAKLFVSAVFSNTTLYICWVSLLFLFFGRMLYLFYRRCLFTACFPTVRLEYIHIKIHTHTHTFAYLRVYFYSVYSIHVCMQTSRAIRDHFILVLTNLHSELYILECGFASTWIVDSFGVCFL